MNPKYTYHIEMAYSGRWVKGPQGSRQFLEGYMYARSDDAPRLAHRLMRSDGKEVASLAARDDVSIGQVAGFPTSGQYERAAAEALAKAEAVRAAEARRAKYSGCCCNNSVDDPATEV